ncbi:MAG TPA: radical SAM protein [Nitrospinota bacterium]|nr:radical SAM protein [Nitrospinota bacterium]
MKLYKHLLNLVRFKLGATEPACGPMKVQWELTYHCNLKCRHCHIWQIPLAEIRRTTLDINQQKKILEDLASNDVAHISFSGGEMFLQKTVYDLISYGKSLGLKIGGNSNAVLITPEIAEKIASTGLDSLYISIDGDNSDTHDNIRGVKGAFDKAIGGVKNLQAANPDISLFFNTTINSDNAGQLLGIAKMAKDLGIDGLTIEMTNTFVKYSPDNNLILNNGEMKLVKDQINTLFDQYPELIPHPKGYFDEFEAYLADQNSLYKYKCTAGMFSAQIHPNGDLFSCPVAFSRIGNLTEKTFKEIWFGQEANSLRCSIKEGHHPICWVTCVSPLNLYLSYLTPTRLHKLIEPKTLKHILQKI